ncbi:hypothetical protein [Collimonas sp. OK242]|jgi:ABC-type transport system involved in multi-copper enzyme maturation permease subunit|uniref:hypothetical protein n=1 Tax=Collimonas sp. OK242 TaxID=1798195 RepID=UPI00115FE24E|nr:hypothetical protein [Collimonas sp. OK242]
MFELIGGFIGGALVEYFRFRKIAKCKAFFLTFLLFTGALAIPGILYWRPNEKLLALTVAIGIGVSVAFSFVAILVLDEILERRKRQNIEKHE